MRYLLFVSCLFSFQILSAQVNFNSIPFSDALKEAQSEGKLIFLQFEAAACNECNDVANKGFENKEVAEKINQTFFCLKITAEHPDRSQIAQTYNINAEKGFGTLFLDNNGTVVHKFLKTTSFSKEYSNQVDIALMKAGETMKINELEKEYQKGNRSFGFLQSLLLKRRSLNFPTDSLLNEYIDALPADSLKSVATLNFIAQMTPLLDSKADKVLRKDPATFNRVWYTMSLQMRSAINNAIINRSMVKAIKEKNENYAVRTASFAQNTNAGNYMAGAKAYDVNMLRFFDETNDTTKYFRKAIAYYDKYFLPVSPDSIKRLDSLALKRTFNSPSTKKDTIIQGNTKRITVTVPFRPLIGYYSKELNDAAYKFYLRTDNPYLLSIATEWAEKALQFFKTPAVLDTYAKLLYKQHLDAKAIEVMTEAIALQQKRGFPTKDYDAVLEAMKNKKPLKD